MTPGEAAPNAQLFLLRSFLSYSVALAKRRRARGQRTPDTVRVAYDDFRGKSLERLSTIDWDSYIFLPPERGFVLVDDRVEWRSLSEPRRRILDRLTLVTQQYARPGATVVEFGSGDGRNLMLLKRLFPALRFVGLELSPVSVDLARRAALQFGADVEFHVADACDAASLPATVQSADLAFSCFALEMMPRIFTGAVANMLRLSSGGVLFLEPIPELWPSTPRGLVSKLRARAMDRLHGLPAAVHAALVSGEWRLERMERSGLAINALNEMCEIQISKVPK
jgi:trans-aconitate methyltransferase